MLRATRYPEPSGRVATPGPEPLVQMPEFYEPGQRPAHVVGQGVRLGAEEQHLLRLRDVLSFGRP